MSQSFEAIFQGGHLVPLEPVGLREQERVRVRVESVLVAEGTQQENGSTVSVHDALVAAGLLGVVDETPDLSTNPQHMEGFGEDERRPG